MNRREALKLAGAVGAGAVSGAIVPATVTPAGIVPLTSRTTDEAPRAPGELFTPHERRTVRVLVDDILPRDERSGSATDAKVPEFIEASLLDTELERTPLTPIQVRGGLAWLDAECRRRFEKPYADCDTAERHQVLDDIAWPAKARPEMQYGAAFFSGMRDFTASGFFTSEMGYQHLRYQGNTMNPSWNGCPQAALDRLGVSYVEWDKRYAIE
jgi:hypothetical protein